MKQHPMRVLIVEDHDAVATALASLVNDERDMQVIGTAASVADSIAQAAELKPDIVLMDFRLPDGNGADAGTAIRADHPDTKLIFVTRDDTRATRRAATTAGASGFIHKSRATAEVIAAIRAVAGGRTWLKP